MTRTVAVAIATAALAAAAVGIWSRPDQPETDRVAERPAAKGGHPVGPLPRPEGPVVLTIAGGTGGNAAAGATEVDFATLERELSQEELTVYEPFVKKNVTFTGVPMSDLLSAARVDATSGSLYMHALDDYTVELPLSGVASDGLLATRVDGKRIPVAEGGPIRLIFGTDSELGSNPENWIWSVDSMRPVR